MELLTKIDFWPIMIIALITTLFVSAVSGIFENLFQSRQKKKLLVVISAAIVTLTYKYDGNWQDIIQTFLLAWSFAILFYSYLGGWFVAWIFRTIKKKLIGKKQ